MSFITRISTIHEVPTLVQHQGQLGIRFPVFVIVCGAWPGPLDVLAAHTHNELFT